MTVIWHHFISFFVNASRLLFFSHEFFVLDLDNLNIQNLCV